MDILNRKESSKQKCLAELEVGGGTACNLNTRQWGTALGSELEARVSSSSKRRVERKDVLLKCVILGRVSNLSGQSYSLSLKWASS